jgi:hypothetical protein
VTFTFTCINVCSLLVIALRLHKIHTRGSFRTLLSCCWSALNNELENPLQLSGLVGNLLTVWESQLGVSGSQTAPLYYTLPHFFGTKQSREEYGYTVYVMAVLLGLSEPEDFETRFFRNVFKYLLVCTVQYGRKPELLFFIRALPLCLVMRSVTYSFNHTTYTYEYIHVVH